MQVFLALLLVLALLGILLVMIGRSVGEQKTTRKSVRRMDSSTRHRRQPLHPYQAVSICAMDGACEAVSALVDKRYLVADSPQLPVPGCDIAHCKCKYVRFEDRRKEGWDRRLALRGDVAIFVHEGGRERRNGRGRRKSDLALA